MHYRNARSVKSVLETIMVVALIAALGYYVFVPLFMTSLPCFQDIACEVGK